MPVPVKNIGGKQADNRKLPPMMGQSFGRQAEPPEPDMEAAPAPAPTEAPVPEEVPAMGGNAQIAPEAAGYVPECPKCSGCTNFQESSCVLVSGPIAPDGYCKLHSPGESPIEEEVPTDAPMVM